MRLATSIDRRETRCAIYTRKSVEQGLEQEYNSLAAQRSICSAYIASQRPKGWVEMPKHYDDGGKSGATLLRPALQDLLCDVESGVVDVVVIYKLDRITRSLLDFVRLMDLFGQYGVGFVAVTQNFDTADSTGRLILNILLTFAQFEREIVSDRLKDKFTAMKQRGMFVGGHPPYGYDLIEKHLVANEREAQTVRWIFRRYLECQSYRIVARELREKNVVRRTRTSKRGLLVLGRPICASSVWQMLGNPIYTGDVRNKGRIYPGAQQAIVGRKLWNDVQDLRAKRTRAQVVEIYKTDLLRDLMVDCFGRKVSPFRDYRYSKVTRHYRSVQTEWGRRHGVRTFRTRAEPIEQLVVAAITSMLCDRERLRAMLLRLGIHDNDLNKLTAAGAGASKILATGSLRQVQCVLKALIERIELSGTAITVIIRSSEIPRFLRWDGVGFFRGDRDSWSVRPQTDVIEIPSSAVSMKREMAMLLRKRAIDPSVKPNPKLVALLKRARLAQAALDEREFTGVTELAKRVHCHPKHFTELVRLNYLAPDIVASIQDGTQPPHINCNTLRRYQLPMDWSLQRRLLGFPDQPDYLKAAPGW